MSDAATYRTKDEVEQEKQKDPILKLRKVLLDKRAATEAQLDAIDDEEKAHIEKAIAFADASPLPPDADVWTHGTVEPGEPDEHPRERVLGATDVKWPVFPTDFKVTWDLEPRTPANPAAKKGAA